jgi:hypothetical protein
MSEATLTRPDTGPQPSAERCRGILLMSVLSTSGMRSIWVKIASHVAEPTSTQRDAFDLIGTPSRSP